MGYENTVLRSNQPGGVYTFSNPAQGYALPSASQMQDYAFGVQAYTTDLGLVYWNGTSWNAIGGGIVINATNINPTNSATTNTANLNAAIATAYAAGGGTIQLGAYSSPIPINNSSGPILLGVSSTLGSGGADTPYSGVRIVGSGYTINQNTQRAVSGTVLQGTSLSYPILAYNYVDNTADYSSAANLSNSFLQNFGLSNIAFDTCSYGIKIGALGKVGCFLSQINNLYVSNFANWAIWLENYQYNEFSNLNAAAQNAACVGGPVSTGGGMMFFGESLTNSGGGGKLIPGNTTFRRLFAQAYTNSVAQQPRGIVFQARNSAGGLQGALNDVNVFDIQCNTYVTTTVTSATATSGAGGAANQLTLTALAPTGVTLAANFPVDMPVFFSSSSSPLGGNALQYQTLFVVFNNGTYIQLSATQGGSPITFTASSADTLYSWGWPPIELVGYQSGNLIQAMTLTGVDSEANGTTMIYGQAANAVIDAIAIASYQGTSTSSACASSIAGRSSSTLMVRSSEPLVLDYDSLTSLQSITFGALGSGTQTKTAVQGYFPVGLFYDNAHSSGGLSLGSNNSSGNQQGAQLIVSNKFGQAFFSPQIGLGQRQVYDTFGGSSGFSGYDVGSYVFRSSSSQTRTLPTFSSDFGVAHSNAGGVAANSSIGAPFEIYNDNAIASGFNLTVNAGTSQNFNNNSNLTNIIVPPQASLVVRAVGNGSAQYWEVLSMRGCLWAASDPTVQAFTSGASGTVNAGVYDASIILDGVGTTFSLTFPTAFGDKQIVRVLSATAVSTAFSITGSGDGSTIKTVPATTTAGAGYAWEYRAANTTWYRLY